jgi:hypothetical protein
MRRTRDTAGTRARARTRRALRPSPLRHFPSNRPRLLAATLLPLSLTGMAFAVGRPATATPAAAFAADNSAAPDRASPAEAHRVDQIPTPVLHRAACRQGDECATANLPLDYDDPKGPTIEVALLRVKAKDPAHRLGTLFVNPGGPGDRLRRPGSAGSQRGPPRPFRHRRGRPARRRRQPTDPVLLHPGTAGPHRGAAQGHPLPRHPGRTALLARRRSGAGPGLLHHGTAARVGDVHHRGRPRHGRPAACRGRQ